MTATKGDPSITRDIITRKEIKYFKNGSRNLKKVFSKAHTIAGFAFYRKLKI